MSGISKFNPVLGNPTSATFTVKTTERNASDWSQAVKGDTVDISEKAIEKYDALSMAESGDIPADNREKMDILKQEMAETARQKRQEYRDTVNGTPAEKEEGETPWDTRYGLKAGTSILSNGNKQVISIKDDEISILEYKGDKLVSKTTGFMDDDSLTTSAEYYNEAGEIVQTVNTFITGQSDSSSTQTQAAMKRDINWYEHGELVREMHDSQNVNASYSGLNRQQWPPTEGSSLEEMVSYFTRDKLSTNYSSSILEYDDGRLIRSATINHTAQSDGGTDRRHVMERVETGDKNKPRTDFSQPTYSLSMSVTDYDHEGNVSRDARFTEYNGSKSKGLFRPSVAFQKQTSSVSWYDNGQLVKRSEGSLEAEGSPSEQPSERSGMLGILGLTGSEYATAQPQSAGEILATKYGKQQRATDGQATGWEDHFGDAGEPDSMLRSGSAYEISITNEIYSKGKIVARQTDTQKAKDNTLPIRPQFRTGKGLTEDDIPALLHSSEHTEESFDENGQVETRAELSTHESMKRGENDTYSVETYQHGTITRNSATKHLSALVDGYAEDVDKEFDKAREKWELDADLTVDDVMDLMDENDDKPQWNVRLEAD